MKWFFGIGVILSIVFGTVYGRMSQVSQSAIGGGTKAIELVLILAGGICFWSGVMNVAQKCGITKKLSNFFSPVLKLILRSPSNKTSEAVSMNISANLLGLGNAATPFGINAMKEMKNESGLQKTASHNMIVFVILNTSSLQLIPTTVATLRLANGSSSPMAIILPMIVSSFCALVASLVCVKVVAHLTGDKS